MRRVFSGPGRRRLGAAVALAGAVVVVVILVLSEGGSSSSGSTPSPAARGANTATVARRNLVQTDTESGTLGYTDSSTVYNRLGGTITWLPAAGQEIRIGQPLFRVDGQPVVLMNGTTPAYRTLAPGISDGPDVLELNRNLIHLGFDSGAIVDDDVWQAATTAGVDLFQESLGEQATGTLSLGQVVFLPGNQLVSQLEATLGGAGGGGGSGQAASVDQPAAGAEFVALRAGLAPVAGPGGSVSTKPHPRHRRPRRGSAHPELSALVALLRAEVAQLRAEERSAARSHPTTHSSPSSSSGHAAHGVTSGAPSAGGGAAQAILDTSSTNLVVTVDLSASLQSEAVRGERVTVEMPAGNVVRGRISAVSRVAQSSSNSGGGTGSGGSGGNGSGNGGGSGGSGSGGSGSAAIPVTISLDRPPRGAGLDQAAVSVNFAQQRARQVLSVPVTALLATSGQSYAVQEADPPHRLIPVSTGLFAAGYVQISGPGLRPGLQVTDSQG